MPRSPARKGLRLLSLLTALSTAAACAPAGPGLYQSSSPFQQPGLYQQSGLYQQQASNAAYACQQGIQQACYDYQALAPAANAEVYEDQRNAQVGTAVAAGLIGAVAGAAIASSARRPHDRDRGYHGPRRGYHRGGYHRY